VAHLPSIEVPMLVVQGERDPFGTPDELQPIIEKLPARVTLHAVEGGDHSLAARRAATSGPRVEATVLDTIASWVHDV
jgi:hypothetical protein